MYALCAFSRSPCASARAELADDAATQNAAARSQRCPVAVTLSERRMHGLAGLEAHRDRDFRLDLAHGHPLIRAPERNAVGPGAHDDLRMLDDLVRFVDVP